MKKLKWYLLATFFTGCGLAFAGTVTYVKSQDGKITKQEILSAGDAVALKENIVRMIAIKQQKVTELQAEIVSLQATLDDVKSIFPDVTP